MYLSGHCFKTLSLSVLICSSSWSSAGIRSHVHFNGSICSIFGAGLMTSSLQVYVLCPLPGDCVYLMRDSRRTPDGHPVRQSYRLLSHINREKLDIFRIEKLWKNEKYVQGISCIGDIADTCLAEQCFCRSLIIAWERRTEHASVTEASWCLCLCFMTAK